MVLLRKASDGRHIHTERRSSRRDRKPQSPQGVVGRGADGQCTRSRRRNRSADGIRTDGHIHRDGLWLGRSLFGNGLGGSFRRRFFLMGLGRSSGRRLNGHRPGITCGGLRLIRAGAIGSRVGSSGLLPRSSAIGRLPRRPIGRNRAPALDGLQGIVIREKPCDRPATRLIGMHKSQAHREHQDGACDERRHNHHTRAGRMLATFRLLGAI